MSWPAPSAILQQKGEAMAQTPVTLLLIEGRYTLSAEQRMALAPLGPRLVTIAAASATAQLATIRPAVAILCAPARSALAGQVADLLYSARLPTRVILVARRMLAAEAVRALRLGFHDLRTIHDSPTTIADAVREALVVAQATHQDDTDMLLSLVSHELRSPLTTIRGYLELLRKYQGRLPVEKTLAYLDNSLMAMQEATALTDTLTNIMRIEEGQLALTHVPVRLALVVRDTVEQYIRFTDRHTVHSDIPEDLAVLAEPQSLIQIVRNLLSNAIKYSPDGGLIQIAAHAEGDHVVLSVRDTGIGIAPEAMPRLFTRFARVHDQTRWPTIQGTGLGLYLCRHLVEALDGTISAQSIPGVGTTFTVHIPAAPARLPTRLSHRNPARSAS